MKCPFIIGKKIYLRPLGADDLEKGYLGWINDPEVNKFLMAGSMPTSMQGLREYYEKVIRSKTDVMFAIVIKKTDKYIGNIKIGDINWIDRRAHCGRLIGDKKSWGKGYGTEALMLVMDYAFNTLNLNRLYNTIIADNIAAIRSCEKLGMKKEGVFSQCRFIRGEYRDVVQVAITRERYNALRKKK